MLQYGETLLGLAELTLMNQSIFLQQSPRRSTSAQKLQSGSAKNPTKSISRTILVWGLLFAFTLPLFRSGLKSQLTFAQWVWNHTIFGDPVEFIPRENYEEIFKTELGGK